MPLQHGQRGWLTRVGHRREWLAFPCHRGAGKVAGGLFVGQPLERKQGLRGRGGATQPTAPPSPPCGCVRSPSSYSTAGDASHRNYPLQRRGMQSPSNPGGRRRTLLRPLSSPASSGIPPVMGEAHNSAQFSDISINGSEVSIKG
jgi:hypothetical protein